MAGIHQSGDTYKELVREGAVGPVEFIRASCRGNLLEQGTHLLDLVMSVQLAALRRCRITPGDRVADREIEALRTVLQETENHV